jgi:hypothetical protein
MVAQFELLLFLFLDLIYMSCQRLSVEVMAPDDITTVDHTLFRVWDGCY